MQKIDDAIIMQRIDVAIITEFITVDKLLKFAGVVDSGGQAFQLVLDGLVKLNGVTIQEKRKKVFVGDVVNIDDQVELTIVKDENI